MKKLFFAAMALAAIVSCSKSDEPTLDSSKKSVSIKIENMVTTRGVTKPSATADYKVADADDLYVAFCDASGAIVGGTHQLTTGSTENTGAYTFHALPETVTQFFVFGNDNGTLTSYASLSAAETAWNESPTTQENDQIKDVIVFGKSGTITYVKDCVDPEGDDAVKYQLFEGSAIVKPNVARVEILSIGCSDLGARDNDGNTTTLGFDKLDLTTIKLGSMDEDLADYVLEANVVDGVAQLVTTAPANDEVWSWNFEGGSVANYPLALTLDATSTAYIVSVPTRTVIASSYTDNETNEALTSFEKGNVYKMNVVVTEKNLLGNDTNICVAVTVTINDWIINNITPNFGN